MRKKYSGEACEKAESAHDTCLLVMISTRNRDSKRRPQRLHVGPEELLGDSLRANVMLRSHRGRTKAVVTQSGASTGSMPTLAPSLAPMVAS